MDKIIVLRAVVAELTYQGMLDESEVQEFLDAVDIRIMEDMENSVHDGTAGW